MQMHTTDGGCRVDTHRPIPACSGPCRQGRDQCATPDACQQPEQAPELISADTEMFIKLLVMALASVLVCIVIVHWIAGV